MPQFIPVSFRTQTCNIAVYRQGSGSTAILFVHGLKSSAEVWEPAISLLKNKYTCISISLPGHGASGTMPVYSLPLFVTVIRQVLCALQTGPIILTGHSMGGLVSLLFAAENPMRVQKLVLAAPAGFEVFTSPEKNLLLRSLGYAAKPNPLEGLFLDAVHFRDKTTEALGLPLFSGSVKGKNAHTADGNLIPDCVASMLNSNAADWAAKVKIPALLLFGENDRLIPNPFLHPSQNTAQIARKAFAAFPQGLLRLYKNCGHYLQTEQPAAFASDLEPFIG